MATRLRVFKSGTECLVTGPTKLKRRVLFVNKVKVDGREILLFRAVKKMKKQRP
jgi:hypothetical protein